MSIRTEATIDDLYRVPENGKAELVDGELVLISPTGGVPGRAAGEIYVSLHSYEKQVGGGYAFPDNVGFIVNLPNRRSFSPDAAFYKGELRGGLFLEGSASLRGSKFVAQTTTAQKPKSAWRRSEQITLRQEPW